MFTDCAGELTHGHGRQVVDLCLGNDTGNSLNKGGFSLRNPVLICQFFQGVLVSQMLFVHFQLDAAVLLCADGSINRNFFQFLCALVIISDELFPVQDPWESLLPLFPFQGPRRRPYSIPDS